MLQRPMPGQVPERMWQEMLIRPMRCLGWALARAQQLLTSSRLQPRALGPIRRPLVRLPLESVMAMRLLALRVQGPVTVPQVRAQARLWQLPQLERQRPVPLSAWVPKSRVHGPRSPTR